MKLQKPWPEPYTINARSPFGPRKHPITGRVTMHHGIDVAMPVGTLLTAPADGIVVHKGKGGSGGVTLILKHANNLHTVYYHLQKPSHLKKGDRVETGDSIALSGNTGASTGPHLHMELRRSRRWGDTMDPVPYLKGKPSVVPPPLKVDGRLGRKTWKAFQQELKDMGYYKGIPDGRPGVMTYRAIQTWAKTTVDGVLGPQTRRAVQKKLGVKQDGKWGRITISELQRRINNGTL